MTRPLDIVVFGLSLTSSWGNGHATTYRALLRGLAEAGHRVRFLERDVPWYASHRDLPDPDFCTLRLYDGLDAVLRDEGAAFARADAVIVGSYVPEGVTLIDRLAATGLDRLCFYDIDTPVTLARLERGDEEYIARRQIPLFDIYFSFSGGEVLDVLERDWGARCARALHCAVDADRYRPTGEAAEWDLGYLGTYSADRQPALEQLLIRPARALPHMRFVVAGPGYPETIDWPGNVERIDHVPPAEHTSFYNRQRFTLNITRADMVAAGWSPSVRLFEAAACGTPIVSDRWRGLTDLFPEGEAICIADGPGDVIETLCDADADRRATIARNARDIVLSDHTAAARAADLARALRASSRGQAAAATISQEG